MLLEIVDSIHAAAYAAGDVADTATTAVTSSSDSDGSGRGLLFLLLLAGPGFYALMFVKYRNVDKRQRYEAETKAETDNVTGDDTFSHSLSRLRSSHMTGANNTSVRGSTKSWF